MFNRINDKFMEMFENRSFDQGFINIELDNFIKEKLLDHQHLHVYNIISCLQNNKVAIDGSDTGTGKTFTSIAIAKHLNLKPLIICPKNCISIWKNVCSLFNVKPLTITNYELIKNGKCYDHNNNIIKSNYINVDNKSFKWNLSKSKNIIVIFDEAHKCKNYNSMNGKLLLSLYNVNVKILLLSATLCDNPNNFTIYGYMIGLYDSIKKGKKWIQNIMLEQNKNRNKNINIVHKYLYSTNGSRMNFGDIKDNYPMNQISFDCFDIDHKYIPKINNYYSKIKNKYNRGTNALIKINYERQQIEKIKLPIIITLINKYLEHNKSIAIFVNYRETLLSISKYLDKKNICYSQIHGSQNSHDRENNINSFQNNENRIIICMIQTGGQSINLHDINGRYPRVSIISPSFSSTELLQSLGRIYRTGVKSPCLQIVLFCANTIEEKISSVIKEKINFLDKISNNDLLNILFNK